MTPPPQSLLARSATMKLNKTIDQAYAKALNQISYRPRSIFEIKNFLSQRDFSDKIIDKVITKLTRQRYLDDPAFARVFVSSQKEKNGPFSIKAKLRLKGIDPAITEAVLAEIPLKEVRATAQKLLQKRHFELSDPKQVAKARQYLLRHGFPHSMINELAGLID